MAAGVPALNHQKFTGVVGLLDQQVRFRPSARGCPVKRFWVTARYPEPNFLTLRYLGGTGVGCMNRICLTEVPYSPD